MSTATLKKELTTLTIFTLVTGAMVRWRVGQGFVVAELIDPETGEVKEMIEGETGELVYTTIDREATPVLRYRSRDLVKVYTEKCECGRTSFRFEILGRSDDMIKVKAINIFPLAIRNIVSEFSPKTTGEIRIILQKPGHIQPELWVKVEYGEKVSKDELPTLEQEISKAIREKILVTPKIELVPPGSLERSEYKTIFFER